MHALLSSLRRFLPYAIAFTVGTTTAAVSYERKLGSANVATECAYHEGYNEGYRDRDYEATERTITTTPTVVYRADGSRIEETDPDWNCQTMGNGICGPIATR